MDGARRFQRGEGETRAFEVTYTYASKCIPTTGRLTVVASTRGRAEADAREWLVAHGVRVLAIDYVTEARG